MIFLFLFSCVLHRTSLVGVIDVMGEQNCTIELESGELITIESSVCNFSKEGDLIQFYASKK